MCDLPAVGRAGETVDGGSVGEGEVVEGMTAVGDVCVPEPTAGLLEPLIPNPSLGEMPLTLVCGLLEPNPFEPLRANPSSGEKALPVTCGLLVKDPSNAKLEASAVAAVLSGVFVRLGIAIRREDSAGAQ